MLHVGFGKRKVDFGFGIAPHYYNPFYGYYGMNSYYDATTKTDEPYVLAGAITSIGVLGSGVATGILFGLELTTPAIVCAGLLGAFLVASIVLFSIARYKRYTELTNRSIEDRKLYQKLLSKNLDKKQPSLQNDSNISQNQNNEQNKSIKNNVNFNSKTNNNEKNIISVV